MLREVFDTLTEEQKTTVYAMIGQVIENAEENAEKAAKKEAEKEALMVRNMLKAGLEMEQISQISGLSVSEIEKFREYEYFCTKCGAVLNGQPGFDPDNGTWTCTECGQFLFGEDVDKGDLFPGTAWYCDNCGALLNKQAGFSDSYGSWTCTACSHKT
jgi:ribosomal protein L37AE/L43A